MIEIHFQILRIIPEIMRNVCVFLYVAISLERQLLITYVPDVQCVCSKHA